METHLPMKEKVKIKLLTSDSAFDMESRINDFLDEAAPDELIHVVPSHFYANGANFYTATLIMKHYEIDFPAIPPPPIPFYQRIISFFFPYYTMKPGKTIFTSEQNSRESEKMTKESKEPETPY